MQGFRFLNEAQVLLMYVHTYIHAQLAYIPPIKTNQKPVIENDQTMAQIINQYWTSPSHDEDLHVITNILHLRSHYQLECLQLTGNLALLVPRNRARTLSTMYEQRRSPSKTINSL